jgi:outer membrane receptor protein involved in Fe transport
VEEAIWAGRLSARARLSVLRTGAGTLTSSLGRSRDESDERSLPDRAGRYPDVSPGDQPGKSVIFNEQLHAGVSKMRMRACNPVISATCIVFGVQACLLGGQPDPNAKEDFLEMSIEELMNVEVASSATLTQTAPRLVPAAVTVITQEQIRASGARSLDELLEIYVPNLQIALHLWEPQHLGLRGSISDRDDKYLLLVNGRVMNERLHYGAIAERDLPLLQDIHHIDVVRGPGSVLYGAGALFMVINIVTDNAATFQGAEVTGRAGAFDKFSGVEAKYGKKFDDESGLFLYAGIADQPGASPEDAEFTPGRSWTVDGIEIRGDDPFDNPLLPNHNSAYRSLDRVKIHGEYQKDDWTFWTRYTRGGSNYYPWIAFVDHDADGPNPIQGSGYQQLTFLLNKKVPISEQFDFDGSVSYDIMDYERRNGASLNASRQDELNFKGIFNWHPHETLSVAFGGEFSRDWFGKGSIYRDDVTPLAAPWGVEPNSMPRWHTDTYSILGELQWRFADKWLAFLGGRIDWHPFIEREMFSPRVALIHELTEKDTLKAIVSNAVRASTAEDMKKAYDEGNKSEYEDMLNYELQWQRQQASNLWFGVSAFYNERDVVAWDQGNSLVAPLGEMGIYGVEAEVLYRTDRTSMGLSHGYSQLSNFKLDDPSTDQFFTSEPYGYGNDLAAWHDHITKFNISHDVTKRLNINGSFIVYWGSEGRKDYLEGTIVRQSWDFTPGVSDKKIGDPAYFLNLGLGYTFDKHVEVAFHAHNVLGWLDDSLNHRDYAFSGIQRSSTMTLPPAVSFALTYRF